MHCDVCGSSDSIFFIKPDGSGVELRLCRSCAVARGYASEGSGLSARVESMFDNESAMSSGICATCGCTATVLHSSGRLGCPDCVKIFRREILAALKRAGSRGPYEGKVPRRNLTGVPSEPAVADLAVALEEAIRSEDFEAAATLRDRIKAGFKESTP